MRDRIVVVGAGIGGLSIANGLKKLGYEVTVLEAAKQYSEVNTGLRLWSFGVAGLVELGISLDDLKAAGLPNDFMITKKHIKGKCLTQWIRRKSIVLQNTQTMRFTAQGCSRY